MLFSIPFYLEQKEGKGIRGKESFSLGPFPFFRHPFLLFPEGNASLSLPPISFYPIFFSSNFFVWYFHPNDLQSLVEQGFEQM
ncbi:hypothetical protein CW755_06355 [Geobacillus thermodenitrificans]|nr:hypothetical protein CW755_06355 [Geobacillus thermodenitrificans]